MQSQFVPVSKEFKGHVTGKRGSVIREIHQKSGAQITSTSTEEEGFTTSGNAQQIAHAKRLILQKVVSCKDKCLHFTLYLDLILTVFPLTFQRSECNHFLDRRR